MIIRYQGDASEVITRAVQQVESKYQDVQRLEQSINELSQVFTDFALVVDQQGELLINIETHVKAANNYIDEGNIQMDQAVVLMRNRRKCQGIICLIVLIIIGIIVGVVVAKSNGSI